VETPAAERQAAKIAYLSQGDDNSADENDDSIWTQTDVLGGHNNSILPQSSAMSIIGGI
jgi:ABC-type tungstate transport system permease subunit